MFLGKRSWMKLSLYVLQQYVHLTLINAGYTMTIMHSSIAASRNGYPATSNTFPSKGQHTRPCMNQYSPLFTRLKPIPITVRNMSKCYASGCEKHGKPVYFTHVFACQRQFFPVSVLASWTMHRRLLGCRFALTRRNVIFYFDCLYTSLRRR